MNQKGFGVITIIPIVLILIAVTAGLYFFSKKYVIIKKPYLEELEVYRVTSIKLFDDLRAKQLSDIKHGIDQFYHSTSALPSNYIDIVNYMGQSSTIKDPVSDRPYIYQKNGNNTYKLCANYEASSGAETNEQVTITAADVAFFSAHTGGNNCFDLSILKTTTAVTLSNPENMTGVNIQTCTNLPDLPVAEGIKITGIYETSDSIFVTANRAVSGSIEFFNWDVPSQRNMQNLSAAKSFDIKAFSTLYPKIGYKITVYDDTNKKVTSDSILFEGSKIRTEDPRCSSSYQHLPSF